MTQPLVNPKDISVWLDAMQIKNYEVSAHEAYGFVVNVKGSVDLRYQNLREIPVKFDHVSGNFDCSYNHLDTLKNVPQSVDGDFNCNCNQLVSLQDAPASVGGEFFNCDNQLLKTKSEIIAWLESMGVDNYTLHPDRNDHGFVVDLDKNMTLLPSDRDTQIDAIRVQFRVAEGIFDCSNNNLKSLLGCPQFVGGAFLCSNNQLTSLEFCPKNVADIFCCDHNNLKSLEYCPERVAEMFFCFENKSLGALQEITDFKKIYEHHQKALIEKEKASLNEIVATVPCSKTKTSGHKI